MLTFAVGLSLSPSRIGKYVSHCVAISTIKFILRPAIAAGLAYGCMRAGWIDGLAFRVAVLLAATPVAFNALIPPALYDLDEDLANSCWIVTTSLMVVVVPVLFVLLR
jgi:predicted permease